MDGLISGAGQEILKLGFAGAIIVALVAVIVVLDRRLRGCQDAYVENSIKTHTALTQSSDAMRTSSAAQEKAADANRATTETVKLLADRLERAIDLFERLDRGGRS